MNPMYCYCPVRTHSSECGDQQQYSGCPGTFNGAGCPSGTSGWITATNATACSGQQNRASNNFWLPSGSKSGNYKITILSDSLNTNPNQINFTIYHNVGFPTYKDTNLGTYYQGWPVYLNSGNYCYYVGSVSGAVGPVNICFTYQSS